MYSVDAYFHSNMLTIKGEAEYGGSRFGSKSFLEGKIYFNMVCKCHSNLASWASFRLPKLHPFPTFQPQKEICPHFQFLPNNLIIYNYSYSTNVIDKFTHFLLFFFPGSPNMRRGTCLIQCLCNVWLIPSFSVNHHS